MIFIKHPEDFEKHKLPQKQVNNIDAFEVKSTCKPRRGSNIVKQPSSSIVDNGNKASSSNISDPDTISTISPLKKLSNYVMQK